MDIKSIEELGSLIAKEINNASDMNRNIGKQLDYLDKLRAERDEKLEQIERMMKSLSCLRNIYK